MKVGSIKNIRLLGHQEGKKYVGFSAVELLFVLSILVLVIMIAFRFASTMMHNNRNKIQLNNLQIYAFNVARYINSHSVSFVNILNNEGGSNHDNVIVLAPQLLQDEGFISNNDLNLMLNNDLYPCTSVYFDNQQLQAFVYYRTNQNDNNISDDLFSRQDPIRFIDMLDIASNFGGNIGFINNDNLIMSPYLTWSLDSNTIISKFIDHSIVKSDLDLYFNLNPKNYQCDGDSIAKNSFVFNLSSKLHSLTKLSPMNVIATTTDNLHDIDDLSSANYLNHGLNVSNKHNIIFQENPNCLSQDSNNCQNKQLALTSSVNSTHNNSNMEIRVNGFYTAQNTQETVGDIVADTFQATKAIIIGTPCSIKDVGMFAKQVPDETNFNNFYMSQVVCMQHPLCPLGDDAYCYMPIKTITVKYEPNTDSFTCPSTSFVDIDSIIKNPPKPQEACHSHDCLYQPYDCNFVNPRYISEPQDGINKYNRYNTKFGDIYRSVYLSKTYWDLDCHGNLCHFGCDTDQKGSWPTQGTIAKVNCSNDLNKATIIIKN